MAEKRPRQLHPLFPVFQWWAIGKLSSVLGQNPTQVLNYIVTRWMEEHNGDILKQYAASFEDWEKEKSLGPQGVVRPIPPDAGEVSQEENGNGTDGER